MQAGVIEIRAVARNSRSSLFSKTDSASELEDTHIARLKERFGVEPSLAEEATMGGGFEWPVDAGRLPEDRGFAKASRTTLLLLLESP